jgi:hypothetical protein
LSARVRTPFPNDPFPELHFFSWNNIGRRDDEVVGWFARDTPIPEVVAPGEVLLVARIGVIDRSAQVNLCNLLWYL